ncbi:hypothetical protein AGMMS50229_10110 [Campylobacterota bacterium]|nr:hypothetical protein AGMMS50229_10110 [Campylobacterota bacterium]
MKTVEEIEAIFDDGGDISEFVDWDKSTRPNLTLKRINLDLPVWIIEKLGREAKRLGVSRGAVMKMFLAEKCGTAA